MKKTLYFRTMNASGNYFALFINPLIQWFAFGPTLLLEVFSRKDFGERYFRFGNAVFFALVLAVLPLLFILISNLVMGGLGVNNVVQDFSQFGMTTPTTASQPVPRSSTSGWTAFITWYLFIAAFLWVSNKHRLDLIRKPSVFDFARYSKSSGEVNPKFYDIRLSFIENNIRNIECYFEPAIFLLFGLLLYFIGQALGGLLIFCSISLALKHISDYKAGDDFIMDRIDEMIIGEELNKAFLEDTDINETRGFRYRGTKPDTEEKRRKILPYFSDDEEILTAN